MTLKKRMSLLSILDSFIVLFSIYAGYFLIHPIENPFKDTILLISSLMIFAAHHLSALHYGLYRKVWEYASVGELKSIFKAVTFSILVVGITQAVVTLDVLYRTLLITWMLHILLIGGSRLSWRVIRDRFINKQKFSPDKKRTLIIGAGAAGTMITRQLLNNVQSPLEPVAFLDDDLTKKGLELFGIRVLGNTNKLKEIVNSYKIEHIIVAIPSMSKLKRAKLMEKCINTGIKTQTVPMIEDLLTGKIAINEIRDVKIEDLLGREEIQLDMRAISNKLSEKTILVTGAGGSIGSEICRQAINFKPKQLILLGHGENSIYTIDMELRQLEFVKSGEVDIVPIIADIKDQERIFHIISTFHPDVIYHAAAHKHVPLMEVNPIEAVKNNIFGTKNIAEAAAVLGVGHFVMISTDKAVNPPNVMGATKRFAEIIIQNIAKTSKTKFAAVRFGNVLGSRGSVIPLFKKQISEGGPVTVTDERMTRYFMTIPEASRLVIQAGTLAEGGEIFVLDMGEPVKIADLAKNLIRLSGYKEEEIKIEYTGIRPGEKLYEELLNDTEIQQEKVYPSIYIGKATPIPSDILENILNKLPDLSESELCKILIEIANMKSELVSL